MTSKSFRSPVWNQVTAIFGGCFDPPHLGHREAVRSLFQEPGVRRVLILPSAVPPHKTAVAGLEDRLEMVRMNFSSSVSDPYPFPIEFDLREYERSRFKPHRPSFTYDTLAELQSQIPELAYVIGSDQLFSLHQWSRFPALLELAHWIVLDRKSGFQAGGDGRVVLQQWESSGLLTQSGTHQWKIRSSSRCLLWVPTTAPLLSSTEIRKSLACLGEAPPQSLLPEVLEYLREHQLYGIRKSCQ